MKALVFDLETTGLLEDEKTTVTEIAVAKWDVEVNRVLYCESFLVNGLDKDEEITEFITNLTGITTSMVRHHGRTRQFLVNFFKKEMQTADCLIARNGVSFDIPMMKKEFSRVDQSMAAIPCIDDYLDFEYPECVKGRTLSHVAADLGFLNPFPHSAMGDVMTLIKVIQLANVDLVKALTSARSPMVDVIADVQFHNNHLAKEMKFRWNPDKKVWWKPMRKSTVEKTKFPFAHTVKELSIKAIQQELL